MNDGSQVELTAPTTSDVWSTGGLRESSPQMHTNLHGWEVAIYRSVTEVSFDAYIYQALETKASFISEVMTGENASRLTEDIRGKELSNTGIKVIVSGNSPTSLAVILLPGSNCRSPVLMLLRGQTPIPFPTRDFAPLLR
jgi:hypothetical protein